MDARDHGPGWAQPSRASIEDGSGPTNRRTTATHKPCTVMTHQMVKCINHKRSLLSPYRFHCISRATQQSLLKECGAGAVPDATPPRPASIKGYYIESSSRRERHPGTTPCSTNQVPVYLQLCGRQGLRTVARALARWPAQLARPPHSPPRGVPRPLFPNCTQRAQKI
jgi:hypothetical protein